MLKKIKIQVSKMIKKHHGNNYLIFNISGRKYDYSKFSGKVKYT
jgi:hypothetical protein